MAVLAYHSLEDRRVKQAFALGEQGPPRPGHLPPPSDWAPTWRRVTRKAAVASDVDALKVTSRTFNRTADGATYGQGFQGIADTALLRPGQRQEILFMSEDAASRSNLGLLNGVGAWSVMAGTGRRRF